MIIAIIILLLVLLLVFAGENVKSRGEFKQTPTFLAFPYRKKDYFFSKGEKAFFDALRHSLNGEYLIFAHVRLIDLFWAKQDQQKIWAKHIDFVICDHEWAVPLAAIELDDVSHKGRESRDEFVNNLFEQTGFKLIRIKAAASYDSAQLRAICLEHLPHSRKP